MADTARLSVFSTIDSVFVSVPRALPGQHLLHTYVEVEAQPSATTLQRLIVTDAARPGRGQLYTTPFTLPAYSAPHRSGRTTRLRLVTRALKPDSGQVWVGEVNLADDPLEAKRRFSYVPEHGHLYESFPPGEYLAFIGRMHGLDEHLISHRTDALLAYCGLADDAQHVHPGREQGVEAGVVVGAAPRPARHAEGGEPGPAHLGRFGEKGVVGGVGARPAALHVVDAQLV